MSKTRWIGPDDQLSVGDVGFLVEYSNAFKHSEQYALQDSPAYTNVSHQPQLYGWCGTWNDTSTNACGMVKVERVAKNGRALVRPLEGAELQAALEELGYPELFKESV